MSIDASVHITAVRPILLSAAYPPGEELVWVGGIIRSWDAALIEVTLCDGTTGLGEAGAGIMAAQAVPGIIDALRPYVNGLKLDHPLDVGEYLRAYTAFWARGGITSGVLGAVEIASVDAVGKREGVPAHQLLGGLARERIEPYSSGGLGTELDQVLDWALEQGRAGFHTVKFRAMTDAMTTIDLMRYVVPRLPQKVGFVLDAVQGCAAEPWPFDEVIAVGKVAAELGARWYEEPCFATDVEGYQQVRATVDVPVSGVESHGTVREFCELIEAGGVDIAQPDVSFIGGFTALRQVASISERNGLSCIQHTWGSGVTFAANLHAAMSTPNIEVFEYCTLPNPLRESILVQPISFDGGYLTAPTGPGLGVNVSPELESEFAFVPGLGHIIS